ncbi:hypothetical protein MIR68_011700 [Amoeboaphelidium protococcarum]|nr:hypothetical protein MIR68_011700 [Amoeboaphelidium protococcarum]
MLTFGLKWLKMSVVLPPSPMTIVANQQQEDVDDLSDTFRENFAVEDFVFDQEDEAMYNDFEDQEGDVMIAACRLKSYGNGGKKLPD